MSRVAASLLAVGIALLISAAVIAAAGANPLAALTALADGAFGSADGWSEVAVRCCPLLLTGLAVTVAFRAGVWNIGAEGQLLVGATMVAWLGTRIGGAPSWLAIPAVLTAAALGGAAWAAIAAALKVARSVDEVIGTIMLNFIALGCVSYLVHGPLMEASGAYPQTDALAATARLPRLLSGYRVHLGIVLAIAAAGLVHVLLFRTKLGFAMRATGLNAVAARLAAWPIGRTLFGSLAISGALAGLAGGAEVSGVTFRLYEQFSPGYGYTAIAVALLAQLHPVGVVATAVLFAALDVGSSAMQRSAGVSAVLVSVIQATVIFSLLAVQGWPLRSMPVARAAAAPPDALVPPPPAA